MTPLERVLAMYERDLPDYDFWQDVQAFCRVGVVASTSYHFVMGRPIERDNPQPWNHYALYDNPDTWFIWAAAGPSAESVKTFCLTIKPYHLKYIAWARINKPLRFHIAKL